MNVYAVTDATGQALSTSEVNEILEDIGISEETIKTKDEDKIESEASKNNINLNQVQEKAQKVNEDKVTGANETAKSDYQNQLISYGIPETVISQGQEAINAYAAQNNISLPEQSSGTQFNLKF